MSGFVLLALVAGLFWRVPAGLAQDPVLPDTPPDGLSGLELYAERCANCHGPAGQGDGALILEMGGQAPSPFDETYRRASQPSVMFNQITNGNLQVGMPPFGPTSSNPIDDAGRWNLVAAVYSLATPPEDITAGQAVYEASCAACHGDDGHGDGPEAGNDPAPTDLAAAAYWFNRSNETVFTAIAPGAIAAHEYDLSEDDLWRAVDYSRTFSYAYADPVELTRPIPAGIIAGVLNNGTTGELLADTEVNLRAFTPDFTQTLVLTTTTDANGNFRFDVVDVAPDWVFLASAGYNNLSFSSGAGQLSRNQTTLDLPLTVYEQSTDPSALNIDQLHVVLEFVEDQLQVSELYVINNDQDAVFTGPTGNPAEGTIEVALPAGAENLAFQRSFGSMENFLPANDFIPTERGWADTLALRPGPGALTLLVRYTLPYESGMTVAHPLFYETATSTIILPDSGVEITGEPWLQQPSQQFGQDETFLNYSRAGLAAGEAIAFQLQGRPRVVTDASGAATVNPNPTTDLLIGSAALLLAAGVGIVVWRTWRQRQATTAGWEAEVESTMASPATPAAVVVPDQAQNQDELLRAIAQLDDAYEAGQIGEDDYRTRRAALKAQLAAIWQG